MSYEINKTDGTALVTLTDGTIDTSTSLTLFGKSYSGFGELLNENLIKLLENSSSTSAPTAPLKGELWFDTSTGQLKVYDGSAFEPTGGAQSSSTQPSSASAGDLWHDSTNDQMYLYTGSAWLLVGPVYTSGQTLSGWKVETVTDSGSVDRVISSMYVGNVQVCIVSSVTFTPQTTISGFTTISAGLTLNSNLSAVFEGTNTSASFVDTSGTTNSSASLIAGGNFMRKDAANTTTGALTITNDSGITLGAGSDVTMSVDGSNHLTIANTASNGNVIISAKAGSTQTPRITITGSSGATAITGDVTITGNLSVSGELSRTTEIQIDDAFIKLNTGNSEADSGIIVETDDTADARLFYDISENFWTAGHGNSYSQIIRLADLTDDGNANKGTKALTTDSSTGDLKVTTLTLNAAGSSITSATSNSDTKAASVGQVAESLKRWGGSVTSGGNADSDGSNNLAGHRYIGTSAPSGSDGANGDLWFVRES